MRKDSFQLLKYGFITAVLIAGWFVLASLSHNILVESPLGWIGVIVAVLYWRWLLRNKFRPPRSYRFSPTTRSLVVSHGMAGVDFFF